MEKIISDLNVALSNMENKAKEFAVKSAELDMFIADYKKKNKELKDREDFLLDKEALHAELDSLVDMKKDIKTEKVAIAKERSAIEVAKKDIDVSKLLIVADRKKLDELIAIYRNKLNDCNAKIKQLDDDRKNLEKSVIEELTKKLASK